LHQHEVIGLEASTLSQNTFTSLLPYTSLRATLVYNKKIQWHYKRVRLSLVCKSQPGDS